MLVINDHFDKVNYIITGSLNLASPGIILHDRGFLAISKSFRSDDHSAIRIMLFFSSVERVPD